MNNLYPVVQKRLWLVAFVFGLAHGLGFANVLTDLALPRGALAVSLVSFNLGPGLTRTRCSVVPVCWPPS